MSHLSHKKDCKNKSSNPTDCNENDVVLSPSQRFVAFKHTIKHERSMASKFERSLSFELDDFQLEAIDALENDNNVLVAAPTGAGKTVVADFAVFLAQNRNVKAFTQRLLKL